MGVPASRVRVMADDLEHYPDDGNRYEVIDGELLVTATPSRLHQRIQSALAEILLPYARAHGLEVMFAPTDVRAAVDTQVEPDIIALRRYFEGRTNNRWEPMSQLLLAVEILSPSTQRIDRGIKAELFRREAVRDYWMVDGDAGVFEVSQPQRESAVAVRDTLQWQPLDGIEPLTIDVAAFFDEVWR